MTRIESYAFDHCECLTSVTIGNRVTSIGDWAFCCCYSLTNIEIPDIVISIGAEAFYGCLSLKDVYYNGAEEDWNKISIGSGNEVLMNAIHYEFSSPEKHDITIEVRDALTNKLIPGSQIAVWSDAKNVKFPTLSNGKITLKDVSFPIYQMGVDAPGYDYHKSYKNIEYPENGKIVFYLNERKTNTNSIPNSPVYSTNEEKILNDLNNSIFKEDWDKYTKSFEFAFAFLT